MIGQLLFGAGAVAVLALIFVLFYKHKESCDHNCAGCGNACASWKETDHVEAH